MSRKEKLLKKFLEVPPKKDLTFEELETLLLSCGYRKLFLIFENFSPLHLL